MGDSKCDRARWPLSFQMSPTGHGFWSHCLYRGPKDQPVKILYSRTKPESQEIAQEFLGEKVIGFDMEWPQDANTTANTRLQRRIGLIQIACEDKIALFHIGMHSGSNAKDLLAPALRNIIEDPAIAKCGVGVHTADFSRLRQWFGLKPRGAFELTHLHNLVSFGASNPATIPAGLARQVEQHLGLPLHKGKVRTSNWSEPLSKDQVKYAAADAYAGFMLFHCMNAKRMDMDPTPPLPVYAETYGDTVQGKPSRRRHERPLQLVPVHGDIEPADVLNFYRAPGEAVEDQLDVPSAEGETEPVQHNQAAGDTKASLPADDTRGYVRTGRCGKHVLFARAADVGADVMQQLRDQHAAEQQRPEVPGGMLLPEATATKSTSSEAKTVGPGLLDETKTELLYRELCEHRKDLAKERGCAPFVLAHNTHLRAISRRCPRSEIELLRIHGIGKKKLADCGPAWLAIVKESIEMAGIDDATQAREDSHQPLSALPTATQPTPALHTGISFSMQNASLGHEKDGEDDENDLEDEDASDNSCTPLRELSPPCLKRKREVLEKDQDPDPVLQGRPQGRYQEAAESAQLPPQVSPTVTITRLPQNLSTRGQRSRDADESTLAAQGTRTTTLTSASPRPPTIPNKVLRNRIIAFNKLVATTVQLPAVTIEHLVNKLPKTMEELLQVPGILPFANACSRANHDLLGFLIKCAAATS